MLFWKVKSLKTDRLPFPHKKKPGQAGDVVRLTCFVLVFFNELGAQQPQGVAPIFKGLLKAQELKASC